jgi:hypothetical protein
MQLPQRSSPADLDWQKYRLARLDK